jgi:hypothetical protein
MAHASQVAHVQPRVFITTKEASMLRQVESTWYCDDRVRAVPLRVLGGQCGAGAIVIARNLHVPPYDKMVRG